MRTARTIGIKSDGTEVILASARIPADKQRRDFNNLGGNFPKDVVEIHYCEGPFKTRHKDKSANVAKQIADAEKRAADKLANSRKIQAEQEAKYDAERKARAKATADENAKLIAAKEASKAAAAKKETEAKSK